MERLKQCTRKRIGREEGSGDWRSSLSPARIKSTWLGRTRARSHGGKLARFVTRSPAVLSRRRREKGIPRVARSDVNSLYRGKKRGSKQTSLAHPNSTTDASSGKYTEESSEP